MIKTFDIFHPDSNANFFHFQKLFDHLLQHDPNSVLELIFLPLPETGSVPEGTSTDSLQEPTMQRPLIFRTLPYLYEAPVMAVVLSCLFRLKSDRESPITQKLRYIMLQNEQFLEYIVSFLLLPDPKCKMKHLNIII